MSSLSYAEPSVDMLRAEAEATRRRLTGTVDDLRTQVSDTATDIKERLSPAAIKTEVTQYVRDSRDQLWHTPRAKGARQPVAGRRHRRGARLSGAKNNPRDAGACCCLSGPDCCSRARPATPKANSSVPCAAGRESREPGIRQQRRIARVPACTMHAIRRATASMPSRNSSPAPPAHCRNGSWVRPKMPRRPPVTRSTA